MVYIIVVTIVSAAILLFREGMKDAITTAVVGIIGAVAIAVNFSWLGVILVAIGFLVAFDKMPTNTKGMAFPQTTLCLIISILLITCKLEWATISLLIGLIGGGFTIYHACKV